MPPLTLLQLTPSQAFEFPSVKLQSASIDLNLKNVSEKVVAYKIKTTAPKNYLVRPSTGVVSPGEEQVIQIILQPQQIIPESNKDRFLVQAIEVDNTDVELSRDFWTSVPKDLLQDHRLSVTFKPPEGSAASPRPAFASSIAPSPTPASGPDNTSDMRRPVSLPPAAPSDFEAKYNDLLQYCLALDKQKTVVANELNESRQQVETLRQRLKVALCGNCGGQVDSPALAAPASGVDFALWRVVAMIVAVVIVLKMFNLL